MNWLSAIIIAVVEGVTEFLPVSSTGHMILTQSLLGIKSTDYLKLYIVSIQLGAILSVVILYWRRFFMSMDFYYKLFVAFIPAALMGIILGDVIDEMLESPLVVAISLLVGGIVLVFVDGWFKQRENYESDVNRKISNLQALVIGLFQCIALIPGVSRSASTIIGGISQKLSRKKAAEFSFFLAVPTMFAATVKKLLDYYQGGVKLSSENINQLLIGNLLAFIVALIAIRFFITFLTRNGFKLFGWYRIAVGGIILILLALGNDLSVI